MTKQAYREAQRVSPLGAVGLERIRQITREHQAAKVNEVLVDGYTASAAKLVSFPVDKVCSVVFKLIS